MMMNTGIKPRTLFKSAAAFVCILLIMMTVSCNKLEKAKMTESGRRAAEMEMKFGQDALSEAPEPHNDPLLAPRKIIKTGDLSYETTDISTARTRLNGIVKKYGGYISSEKEYTYEGRVEQVLVIRVPAERFDALVAEVSEGAGNIDNKSIVSSDVTEEFIDADARLRVKKDTESRYRELLKKAKTVEEILSIEQHLGDVRAEIESLEGRMRYLKDQISLSTLTVTIHQRTGRHIVFFTKVGQGLTNGWSSFVWFVIGLVNIWPFLILGGLGLYGLGRWRARRKRLDAEQSKQASI